MADRERKPPFDSEDDLGGSLLDFESASPVEDDRDGGEEDIVKVKKNDNKLWYVVHCYSGQENKVRRVLERRILSMGMRDQIFDVIVPTEEEIEVKEGKRRKVEKRIFPGYILVEMKMNEDSWFVVRNTPGVTGFVGHGNDPAALAEAEVQQIIDRMSEETPRVKINFKIGDAVRIIDGPFNEFIGNVAAIDMDRTKVRVMVNFFGRDTPVELDFLEVERAAATPSKSQKSNRG
jgi:transcriptional antiterminator NusG